MQYVCHVLGWIRPSKKHVFRVTRPYLNLLEKPRIFFSGFLEKSIIICILKGEMYKIIYFPEKKNMCAYPI